MDFNDPLLVYLMTSRNDRRQMSTPVAILAWVFVTCSVIGLMVFLANA